MKLVRLFRRPLPAHASSLARLISRRSLVAASAGLWLTGTPGRVASMPAAVVLVETYRKSSDTTGDDGPALQRAVDAAATIGAVVAIPAAGLRLKSAVKLPDNTVLQGVGDGARIRGEVEAFLSANGRTSVKLVNVKLSSKNNSSGPVFTDCRNLRFERVTIDSGDPKDAATLLTFGLRLRGCVDVAIDDCAFFDINDAIYLERSPRGADCDRVSVSRSHFEHTHHGTFFSYPVGVYQYYCKNLTVDGCTFRNIFPGNPNNPAPIGYGVYEGDGHCHSTVVMNCVYETTEPRADTALCLTSTSQSVRFQKNSFRALAPGGGGYLFRGGGGAAALTIAENISRGGGIFAVESGTAGTLEIANNTLQAIAATAAIRVGANDARIASVQIHDNKISGCTGGGIFINYADRFDVSDNDVADVNTANARYVPGHNEFEVAGIIAFGPVNGHISGNRVTNTPGGGGHAQYAIASASRENNIVIDANNTAIGMETAAILNGH